METIFHTEREETLRELRSPETRAERAWRFCVATVAKQVRGLREARRLSQTELAEAIGTKQPKISVIENGDPKTTNLEVATLLKIATALHVRLRISFETFGSMLTSEWNVSPSPELDERLSTPLAEPAAERLRQTLLDEETRAAYSETALFMDLSAQLRALRRQRGLSQGALQKSSGVPQDTISGVENPWDEEPGNWVLGTLHKIGLGLDVRLHVSFEAYSSLLDAQEKTTSESLRRPAPSMDSVLFALPPMPQPSQDASERVQWVQSLVIPWLYQDDGFAVEPLLRWLQGKGLRIGRGDEPAYQWILRGLPKPEKKTLIYENRLAERLAFVLWQEPDVTPLVSEQDDEFLVNLFRTCAGLRSKGALAEPLWNIYKRLHRSKLSGAVRDALLAAIIQNQYGDKPFRQIWRPMIEGGRHRWLRGNELEGYEGLVVALQNPTITFSPATALDIIVRRWTGTARDQQVLRRMTEAARKNDVAELLSRRSVWPEWAAQVLPVVKDEIVAKEGVTRHVVTTAVCQDAIIASWAPGEAVRISIQRYGLPAEVRILEAYQPLKSQRSFYNAVLTATSNTLDSNLTFLVQSNAFFSQFSFA